MQRFPDYKVHKIIIMIILLWLYYYDYFFMAQLSIHVLGPGVLGSGSLGDNTRTFDAILATILNVPGMQLFHPFLIFLLLLLSLY